MEQSDLNLLHTIPLYYLQTLAKLLHLSTASKELAAISSATTPIPETAYTEVGSHLFDPATLQKTIKGLEKTELAILTELVACGGRANSRDLAVYLTKSGLLPASKSETSPRIPYAGEPSGTLYPSPHPHGVFEQALHHLLHHGLLFWGKQTNFAGRDYTSGVYDGVLIASHALQEAFQAVMPHEETSPVRIELEVSEGVRQLQRSLYIYWSLVATLREGLPLVNTGYLGRSALRQMMDLFGLNMQLEPVRTEHDVPRLLFLRLLLMQAGLLQERKGVLHANIPAAEAFFSLPLLERVRRCYHLWLQTPFWNEMTYLSEVMIRPPISSLEPAHEEVMRARQTVVRRLLQEKVDVWIDCAAFIARTKLYAPYLLFPRQYGPRVERYSQGSNPYGLDFRLRRGWLTHREGWHMVEGGFIQAIISGPLHWSGLVETREERGTMTFCVPHQSVTITGDTPVPDGDSEGTQAGKLIVQPNFELVALAPVSELLLVRLDRFAERTRLEHIAQYRLTKASVTRAIQTGLDAETIQQTLERAVGNDIPQNVRYSLVEWERQIRRIELWPAMTLLEVDDAALLDDLFADEQTRFLLGRRLSPLLAEIAPHHLASIQQVLYEQNYLPAHAPAPTSDALDSGQLPEREPQWRLHTDGLLEPLYTVIDRYLATDSARFSEHDEGTGWQRITSTSIQAAIDAETSLDAILRFLQHYCLDGIPPSFLMRLKLWGDGYHGQTTISVEQSPMLYLSEQVLRDCQADEELNTLLDEEVPQQGRLVRVSQEHVQRVMELLRERGFEVE